MSNMEFSGFDSSSTLSKPETCCRNRWRSGWELARDFYKLRIFDPPWVYGDLKKRLEQTLEDVLEVVYAVVSPEWMQLLMQLSGDDPSTCRCRTAEELESSSDCGQSTHCLKLKRKKVGTVFHLVQVTCPGGQVVPLLKGSSIDWQPEFEWK